jgi:predicted metalloendopeptidase
MNTLVAQGTAADKQRDGYTESQRFFLSFAQSSCEGGQIPRKVAGHLVRSHLVERVRVNSAVQNFEEFGKAFQCAKGKPMYPERSCRVW